MKGEQWEEFFSKDSHTDEEMENARESSCCWGSCAVGVAVLGDLAIEDPRKLSELQISEKNRQVKEGITKDEYFKLGHFFYGAILDGNIKRARELWNQIHKKKGVSK